jgi:CheY-like chemotaxis protein
MLNRMEKPRTFLIIDDDLEDKEILQETLNEINPSIQCVMKETCEDGLNYLQNNLNALPDYIFLDLNMPKMNGKQCLKLLKEDGSFKNIPVIIYTTSYQERDKEETMGLGAHYFLTKPTSMGQLKKELRHILTLQPQ